MTNLFFVTAVGHEGMQTPVMVMVMVRARAKDKGQAGISLHTLWRNWAIFVISFAH
jgi:hypothetical protein